MQPYVERDIASGLLMEIFPGQRIKAAGEWYLVCRQDRAEQEKVRIFREWMLAEIAADTDLVNTRNSPN
ncbi:hypothetical protein [Oceanicoccus sagamiensis]|uniref:LysR substrate-binding domain-containing protein n=1 Tax=Oceanicoccus sagamiensis TaxID=716816 RepID=A0A1X9NE25_9GAMM|nr:hypothetical protein [Oceanicoccus sagamiensis]ARN75401.1 hypothetical protein BST96_15550 [Oceanicoccus sagamiensis]